MEVILVLLIIFLPIVSVLSDHKKKEAAGQKQVQSKRIVFPDASQKTFQKTSLGGSPAASPAEKESLPEEGECVFEHKPVVMPSAKTAAKTPVKHTPKAAANHQQKPAAKAEAAAEEQKAKEKIDKKKLIIYSEILKPKFD